jgi:hypothetical protein
MSFQEKDFLIHAFTRYALYGLDSTGVNGTPIHNKGLGRSMLPCHSRRRIC